MYVPSHFAETRIEVLHSLIRDHPFGALVVLASGGLDANHIPLKSIRSLRRSEHCAATSHAPTRCGRTFHRKSMRW